MDKVQASKTGADHSDLTYNLLWAITGSVRVESENVSRTDCRRCLLFDSEENLDLNKRLKSCLGEEALKKNNLDKFQLKDLRQIAKSIDYDNEKSPENKNANDKSKLSDFQYSVPYETSKILNFKDMSEEEIKNYWQSEWIKLRSRGYSKGNIIFNEWAITSQNEWPNENADEKKQDKPHNDWNECDKATYNLILLLGLRRSILFTFEMAPRIFNICLPFGKLERQKNKDEDSHTKASHFLVTPVILLTAKEKTEPENSYFRNTLSVSLLLVPVNETFNEKQNVSAKEMYEIYKRTKFKMTDSPLKNFLSLGNLDNISAEDLLERTCRKIVSIAEITMNDDRQISNQLSKSTHITQCVLTQSLNDEQIEKFHRNAVSIQKKVVNLHDELRSIVTPWLFYGKQHDVVDFKRMTITDKARLGSSGTITVFHRGDSRVVSLMPYMTENFPKNSLKWMFAWVLYMSMSMSLLDVMIHSFYRKLESSEKHKAEVLMQLENEFIEDIDEFYDLDIIAPIYKEEYEKLRKIDGVNQDFQIVKDKMNALKTNVVLKEQGEISKRILDFTKVSVELTHQLVALTKQLGEVNESIQKLTEISIAIAIAAMVIVGLPDSDKFWGAIISIVAVIIVIILIYHWPKSSKKGWNALLQKT